MLDHPVDQGPALPVDTELGPDRIVHGKDFRSQPQRLDPGDATEVYGKKRQGQQQYFACEYNAPDSNQFLGTKLHPRVFRFVNSDSICLKNLRPRGMLGPESKYTTASCISG